LRPGVAVEEEEEEEVKTRKRQPVAGLLCGMARLMPLPARSVGPCAGVRSPRERRRGSGMRDQCTETLRHRFEWSISAIRRPGTAPERTALRAPSDACDF